MNTSLERRNIRPGRSASSSATRRSCADNRCENSARRFSGGDDADFSLTAFEGPAAELRDVLEELATVAMFGQRRLVVVEEADEFISRYRADLENYVARPSPTAVLALEAASWPSNTRLYKAVAAEGLAIDCTAPAAAQLARWLGGWAKQNHAVELPQAAAEMLVETIGAELGLIDQELAEMAPMAEKGKIGEELVARMVGGWRPHRLGNARRRPGRQSRRRDAATRPAAAGG